MSFRTSLRERLGRPGREVLEEMSLEGVTFLPAIQTHQDAPFPYTGDF